MLEFRSLVCLLSFRRKDTTFEMCRGTNNELVSLADIKPQLYKDIFGRGRRVYLTGLDNPALYPQGYNCKPFVVGRNESLIIRVLARNLLPNGA